VPADQRPWLDELEGAAERVRQQLGVSTVSVSYFSRPARALTTLINAGVLGPGEQRRPEWECYPLRDFPAAEALVSHRRPYQSTPAMPGDTASLAIESALGKSSQAAAPLIGGDVVWGELWVASVAGDLPLDPCELPLVNWAAEQFAATLTELIGDLEPNLEDAMMPVGRRRYQVWIDGGLDTEIVRVFTGVPARSVGPFTVLAGESASPEVCELVARLAMLGIAIVAVRRGQGATKPPLQDRLAGDRYEIRLAGWLEADLFTECFEVSVRYDGSNTLVSGRLDLATLAGLVLRAGLLDAELIAITRRA
jgi:hypothetical protein